VVEFCGGVGVEFEIFNLLLVLLGAVIRGSGSSRRSGGGGGGSSEGGGRGLGLVLVLGHVEYRYINGFSFGRGGESSRC